MIYYETNYLAHHGVKGMKWGVRKQEERSTGTRTRRQKVEYGQKAIEKASKRYKKRMVRFNRDQFMNRNRLYNESYNKTLNEYKKKVKGFDPKNDTYINKYEKQFSKDWKQNYSKMMYRDFANNNKHYKKADEIAKKYGLYEVDHLAKTNKAFVDAMIKSDYGLDITSEKVIKKYTS